MVRELLLGHLPEVDLSEKPAAGGIQGLPREESLGDGVLPLVGLGQRMLSV